MLGLAAAGASTLAMMPAGAEGLAWAAWDDGPGASAVHLALLRRDGGAASAAWSVRRQDGYAPTLTTLPGVLFADRPVLLLRFQYGAAFAQAELYGLGADGRPVPLGTLEGALIELAWNGSAPLLRVYGSSDLRGPPACFALDVRARRLTRHRCGGAAPER